MAAPITPSAWPEHPAAESIRRSRVFYAWLTNSLAILILITCGVALWTKEFRTVGEIEIAAAITDTNQADIESALVSALKKASTNVALQESLRLAYQEQTTPIDEEFLSRVNYDLLRERIRYAIFFDQSQHKSSVVLELTGSGTVQERLFVQRLMEHVREIVDFELRDSAEIASTVLAANKASQDALGSATSYVDELRAKLNLLSNALESHQMAVVTETGRGEQLRTELVWLEQELKTEFGLESPEYLGFEEKFGDTLASIQTNKAQEPSSPFQLSSARSDSSPTTLVSMGELRERIAGLPLTELNLLLGNADRALAVPMVDNENIALALEGARQPRLRVTDVSTATNQPVGALAQKGVLLSILMTALVVGWALTLGVNPAGFDTGFGKENSIEKALNLPVVAEMRPLGKNIQLNKDVESRQRVVRMSELVLLGTFLLFVALFALNAEIREAILTNPLHAFSRVIWSLVH